MSATVEPPPVPKRSKTTKNWTKSDAPPVPAKKKTKVKQILEGEVGALQLDKVAPQVILANGRSPRGHTNNSNNEEVQTIRKELFTAMKANEVEQVPKIIEKLNQISGGKSINYKEGSTQLSLTHKCVNEAISVEVLKLLIENGLKVDNRDSVGASALHYAAERGAMEIMKLLLENNANPMLKDRENKIALHKAAIAGKLPAIELLFEYPVLINHQDINGQTALHLAVLYERYDIVKYLVNRGADILILSNKMSRPIDYLPSTSIYKRNKSPYTQTGKKIYKFLKKKGGLKSIQPQSNKNVGGNFFTNNHFLFF